MARCKRIQNGWLFKYGKRRKVWVGRWREEALAENGRVVRVHKSLVLGAVADFPTRREAQAKLDEVLRPINQGTIRPESAVTFATFVEEQWKVLALPTFKASTQHGYKIVLTVHVLPAWRNWRLREIARSSG